MENSELTALTLMASLRLRSSYAASTHLAHEQVVATTASDATVTVDDVSVAFEPGSPLKALVHHVHYINIETQSDCDGDVRCSTTLTRPSMHISSCWLPS